MSSAETSGPFARIAAKLPPAAKRPTASRPAVPRPAANLARPPMPGGTPPPMPAAVRAPAPPISQARPPASPPRPPVPVAARPPAPPANQARPPANQARPQRPTGQRPPSNKTGRRERTGIGYERWFDEFDSPAVVEVDVADLVVAEPSRVVKDPWETAETVPYDPTQMPEMAKLVERPKRAAKTTHLSSRTLLMAGAAIVVLGTVAIFLVTRSSGKSAAPAAAPAPVVAAAPDQPVVAPAPPAAPAFVVTAAAPAPVAAAPAPVAPAPTPAPVAAAPTPAPVAAAPVAAAPIPAPVAPAPEVVVAPAAPLAANATLEVRGIKATTSVLLDNVMLGRGPMRIDRLTPGLHHVEIWNQGAPARKLDVELTADTVTPLALSAPAHGHHSSRHAAKAKKHHHH